MVKNNNNVNSNNGNKIQNKLNNNKPNMADIMLLQQQQQRLKHNFINNTNNNNNLNINILDEDISQPVHLLDKEFTEFMSKFIERNPLEKLSQFKDINEMLIYTKNVIDKLLCYQKEYYERLKSSVVLNNRLNELLMKYDENQRNIVKKVHRLNEETNSNDMRKDAVINIHRTENSNLKQLIPLKMKELELYQEICGEGIENIPKEVINENNNNINENENDEENKKQKIIMKLIKNCVSNYGPLDSLFNKDNISSEDKKNILAVGEKLKLEETTNETNNNDIINNNEGMKEKQNMLYLIILIILI